MRRLPPISSRGCPSLTLGWNFPAAAAEILSPSSAASTLPAPFCFWDPISGRSQVLSGPLLSCLVLRRGGPATRVPRPVLDIPNVSAPSSHIPSAIVRLPRNLLFSGPARHRDKTLPGDRRVPCAPRFRQSPAAYPAGRASRRNPQCRRSVPLISGDSPALW